MSRLVRRLFDRSAKSRRTPTKRSTNPRARLLLQALEGRVVPAVFTVTNTLDDSNPGSLRWAIDQANTSAGADTINFDAATFGTTPQTILLQSALPTITQDLTIDGPGIGAGMLTVARDLNSGSLHRIFTILDSASVLTVAVSDMAMTGGNPGSSAGGAISFSNETLTLDRVVIANNQANSNGGAVSGSGTLTVRDSTIANNSASSSGGGLHMTGGTVLIERSTVSGNTAGGTSGNGGGLFSSATGANATIVNSTFSGNVAAGSGGAMQFSSTSTTVANTPVVRNSTVVNNSAGATGTGNGVGGGGISLPGTLGTLTLQSSIVAGNTAANGRPDIAIHQTSTNAPVNGTNNLVGALDGFTFSGTSANNQFGSAATPLDPQLAALGLNGGPTQTHAPLPVGNSPVIDAGANPSAQNIDQRGTPFVRVVDDPAFANQSGGGPTDIGAVERVAGVPSARSGAFADVLTAGAAAHTFTVTFTDVDGGLIDLESIGTGDVVVTGRGFTGAVPATLVQTSTNVDAQTITATFSVAPPGGTWNGADNGTYFVTVVPGAVSNTGNVTVPGGLLGTFRTYLANTFVVTNTADSGPGSLRQAIAGATVLSGTEDTIVFNTDPANGTDFDDATPDVIELTGTTGFMTINEPVTITGPGSGLLTVTKTATQSYRAFTIDGGSSVFPMAISGMTITGFQSSLTGAAISMQDETLTLTDMVITGNSTSSTSGGGGVTVTGVGTLTILSSVISNNTANPTGTIARGAGVAGFTGVGGGATITIRNSTVANNVAGDNGAGVYVQGATATLLIENSTISGNTALQGGSGGGVYVGNGVNTATIRNTAIINNVSLGGSTVTDGGGGIAMSGSAGSSLAVINSTVSGNSAATHGGGIFMSSGGASILTIQNSTITNNTAGATVTASGRDGGGGISTNNTTGQFILTSTIVSGNSAANGRADVASLADVTPTFSAIGSDTGLNGASVTAYNAAANNNLAFGANLDLQPLGNNGGPTPTHLLGESSAAINRGSNPLSLTTDQRGAGDDTVNFPRLRGTAVDIGAVEVVAVGRPAATLGQTTDVTPANAAALNPYQFTVTYTDDVAVAVASLDAADVTVTGPNGPVTGITVANVSSNVNAPTITVTYQFTAPGGAWDPADSGAYTIALVANQVSDTSNNAAVAGPLGSFDVVLPQTFVVTNTNDTGAGSLRDAVTRANAVPGTLDTIVFNTDPANGTDFDDATPDTITLLTGEMAVTDAVVITGPGASFLTVNANQNGRIFNVNMPLIQTFNLSGMTLTGGFSTGTASELKGGAVRIADETTVLSGLVVTGNFAEAGGGGVAMMGVGASLTILDSVISNNSTAATIFGDGGGVYHQGQALAGVPATLVIRNTTIANNSTFSGAGGLFTFGGNILIENSAIVNNTVTGAGSSTGGGDASGGGITISSFSGTTAVIRNTTISGNGVTVTSTSSASSTEGGGGGIFWRGDGTLSIQNSTIVNNAYSITFSTTPTTWPAGRGGGGISSTDAAGLISLDSTIVANNLSIIDGIEGRPDVAANAAVTANFSLIGVADAGASISGADNKTGTLFAPLDPMLAPLASNGGPTQTHAPLAGSPVIDSGSNTGNLATDQRGFARTVDDPAVPNGPGGATDIGAYEAGAAAPAAPTVASVVVNGGGAQRSEVRSIVVTFSGPVTFAGGNANAAAAFTLTRLSPGSGPVGLTAAVSTDVLNRTVVTLTFQAGPNTDPLSDDNGGQLSLADGRYQLQIAAGAVSGPGGALDGDNNGTAGGDYASPADTAGGGAGQVGLYRLFGDATGNGLVDLADLAEFRGTFNQTGPNPPNPLYLAYLDADNSGTVDLADLGEFRARFNASVFAP